MRTVKAPSFPPRSPQAATRITSIRAKNIVLYGPCLDRLRELPDECVRTCVTSPPYWGLRDYGADGQLGVEATPELFVQHLVEILREVRRVLHTDGTLWVNIGDSYTRPPGKGRSGNGKEAMYVGSREATLQMAHPVPPGLKPKDLIGVPWMLAFALRADGWYLRSDIIWNKPNAKPDGVKDRPTSAHEHLFLLSKSERYYYNTKAIQEPTTDGKRRRNCRNVWVMRTGAYKGAHFATFPVELPARCIRAASRTDDVVLDPFAGSGTTLAVAKTLGRHYIGVELNREYKPLIDARLNAHA